MLVPAFKDLPKILIVSLRFQRDGEPVAGCSGNDLVAVNKWCTARFWGLFGYFSTDSTHVFLQIIHKTH